MGSLETPPPPQVALDADSLAQLNNTESKALLDTIDDLRKIHVGDIVNLPQIIVVGDQSSGKSSVLEAISRVRFPVDGDLCTRFATELVLRRASETAVQVSIQFADGTPEPAGHGDAVDPPFHGEVFNREALPDVIRDAKVRMGIREGGTKRFSRDILRVEISAPDVYPLTLVDLPGIFHSETADQNQADKEVVDQLVASYMNQPKSIILAVVAANNNLANQVVLQVAQKHDPSRERTIGVITKPDLAGPGSANECKYLDLAKGLESMHKLTLGWYVLRNPSESERSSGDDVRDAIEHRFFRSGAWSSILPANRGVESLRKRLSKVLLDHIRTNLPGLIDEIEANLRTRQEALDRLGSSRSTTEELRSYLLGIAEDFQRLARDGIEGRYSNEDFFGGIDEKETKLRAKLRNRNRAFDAVMKVKGARYKILWGDGDAADENPDDGDGNDDDYYDNDDDDDYDNDVDDDDSPKFPAYLQELIDEYGVPHPEAKRETELNAELQSQASFNLGREFPGEANSELALQLFKKQAKPWKDIAWTHLRQVLKVSQKFVEEAFAHIIGADETTLRAVLSDCVDPFFVEREELLREKLVQLLLPYEKGYGLPLEDEFSVKMEEKTLRRLAGRLVDRLREVHPELFRTNARLSRQMLQRAVHDLSQAERDEFATSRVIDMAISHYEMSLRTFVDNVINLAVESCLVCEIPDILTPRKVDRMSANQLAELAAESDEVQSQRLALQNEIRSLRDGLRRCQRHRPREVTAPAVPSRPPTPAGNPTPPSGSDSSQHRAVTTSSQPRLSPRPAPPASTPAANTQAPAAPSLFQSAATTSAPPQTSSTGSIFSHSGGTTSVFAATSAPAAATAPPATGLFSPPVFHFSETPTYPPNASATLLPSTSNSTPPQFNVASFGNPSNASTSGLFGSSNPGNTAATVNSMSSPGLFAANATTAQAGGVATTSTITTTASNGGSRTSTGRSPFVFPSTANNNGGSTNNNVNTGGGSSSSRSGAGAFACAAAGHAGRDTLRASYSSLQRRGAVDVADDAWLRAGAPSGVVA
ncbi:P-loop containing nucleoside triphosphate hydrolase protein [Chaetomium strumarium]|uniref:P-loop containing nucleoside triphosphate hydrolase protein n=1 Tax=Chaetomium strumarium TaxID=1170767 RepID=A0AAJ0H513_9PEZI|nr:P-loop containing nucleoside triphosphate hydrolase protein [Chaetomium strumarium]